MRVLGAAALSGTVARDLITSCAGGDSAPLTTVQTTYGEDMIMAAVADKATQRRMRGWMEDGGSDVLRVNAAGILAKLPGQGAAGAVATVLRQDAAVRRLYTTAVAARVCGLEWEDAARLADDPGCCVGQAPILAERFAAEAVTPRDAGARWCSARMLQELSPYVGRE